MRWSWPGRTDRERCCISGDALKILCRQSGRSLQHPGDEVRGPRRHRPGRPNRTLSQVVVRVLVRYPVSLLDIGMSVDRKAPPRFSRPPICGLYREILGVYCRDYLYDSVAIQLVSGWLGRRRFDPGRWVRCSLVRLQP